MKTEITLDASDEANLVFKLRALASAIETADMDDHERMDGSYSIAKANISLYGDDEEEGEWADCTLSEIYEKWHNGQKKEAVEMLEQSPFSLADLCEFTYGINPDDTLKIHRSFEAITENK